MDFALSSSHLALQMKARRFADEVLLPYEMECEENDGLSPESLRAINDQVMHWEFNALNHSRADGGQGFGIFEQMLVDEQLGRVTGAIWDTVFRPSFPMKFASPAQKAEYLIPTCQGKRRDCYAITERDAGSDPTLCQTTAVKTADGWCLNGEKWFVTVGDWADYILLHAHIDGDAKKSAVFFVDKNLPGVKIKRTPKYTHHFCYKHPEFLFENVIVKPDKILGEPGQGFDFTKSWFIEARIGIAARCIGGATRALEEANDYASKRVQFGTVIRDFQAIEFMLADMAVEIMAAKTLLYKVCWEIDNGQEAKLNHAKVAAVKLYCSEMVGRVCDRAVQILGGRGYMRENAVERLWRDTRVDRIWEGTSEIQRVIVGRQIRKRGLETYTKW